MKTKKNEEKKKLQPFEIGELDQYLFGQGTHYEIYKKLGARSPAKLVITLRRGIFFTHFPDFPRISPNPSAVV